MKNQMLNARILIRIFYKYNAIKDASITGNTYSNETLENTQNNLNQQYQLSIKRGLLAVFVMYAFQLLAGVILSYANKYFECSNNVIAEVDLKLIGVMSLLTGGAMVIFWVWTDIRRFGPSFLPQIGLQQLIIKKSKVAIIILLLLIGTHLFAWFYRSLLLSLIDQGGIIGGGSQMFAHLRDTGSTYGLAAFMLLALFIGPVMEELVFRGYLQSALTKKLPNWAAIAITSLVFMTGHGPMILWPMYFVFSIAWGWVFMYTKCLKAAIALHILNNLFYTLVGVMGWKLLA